MADIWDEIESDIPLSQGTVRFSSQDSSPIAAPTDIWDEIEGSIPSDSNLLGNDNPSDTQKFGRIVSGGASSIIPFGDEVVGGGKTLMQAMSTMGEGDFNWGSNYDQNLNEIRDYQDAYKQASPTGGIAETIFGSLAMPANILGKAGTGIKGAAKVAAEGGLFGGLFGFDAGEGNFENRLKNAEKSAAFGAVLTPVISKALKSSNYITDLFAPLSVTRAANPQRGSIGPVETFSPDELILAKQLKNTPIEQVLAGASELGRTSREGNPLFLPEAVNSPKVNRNARFIANNADSMEFSQTAIEGRTRNAQSRGVGLLEDVSPVGNTFEGAKKLVEASDEIVKTAEKARSQQAKPFYDKAFESRPTIDDPALPELIASDRELRKAINTVQNTAEFNRLPQNSTKVVHAARSRLRDRIKDLKKTSPSQARSLQNTYDEVTNLLHKDEVLAHADNLYSAASTGIDKKTETFLSSLRKITDDKIDSISQIFKLPPERISELRKVFADAGKLDEWDAGIRAHLQNTVESTKQGSNFTNKFYGSSRAAKKLQSALSEEGYSNLSQGLDYENRFFEGKNRYHAGSSTAGNLQEQKGFSDAMSFFGKLKNSDYMGALTHMFSADMPAETAQALARTYFDPKTGAAKLNKILPLLERYAKNKNFAETLASASKVGTAKGISNRDMGQKSGLRKPRTPAQELLGPKSPSEKPTPAKELFKGKTETLDPNMDPKRYKQLTDDLQAKNNKLDPLLSKAVEHVESRGNPKAVSKKGAIGTHQVMPIAIRDVMRDQGIDDKQFSNAELTELAKMPGASKRFGEAYLNLLIKRFDDVELALAAYNGGPTLVNTLIDKYGDSFDAIKKHLPAETRNYVPAVLNKYKTVEA